MLKDSKTFGRGCLLAMAWLAWFLGGAFYASTHGPIGAFLSDMPANMNTYVAAWLLVSTTLLFFAISLLIRGWIGWPAVRRS